MERQPVSSSMFKSIGHDPETNTLEVEFKNGTIGQHEGFSAEKHQELLGAESIGAHYNKHVKPHHKYTRLK